MVSELLTWRRLLTRRMLLAPPAADLILGGGRDSSSAVSMRSMPELRMEMQVGIFAPATACRQPGGFARGTLSPSRPRDFLVCVGVAPDVISARVFRLHGPEAVAALAAAVICRRGRLNSLRTESGGSHSMHWDRRFAIGVSLIWAVLVSGAFYLLAGIERPPSPAAVLADNSRMDGIGQIAH